MTENSVVYLMGLVSEEEALRITDVAASVSGVTRVVQLFETLP
ncbi:MAG: BON domain-containing protein [Haliea sp.]|nr:BON domain-containing protein [Haliea sp.]